MDDGEKSEVPDTKNKTSICGYIFLRQRVPLQKWHSQPPQDGRWQQIRGVETQLCSTALGRREKRFRSSLPRIVTLFPSPRYNTSRIPVLLLSRTSIEYSLLSLFHSANCMFYYYPHSSRGSCHAARGATYDRQSPNFFAFSPARHEAPIVALRTVLMVVLATRFSRGQ